MTLLNHDVIFKHMIELIDYECVFCTTQVEESKRMKIFLIFKEKGRIYSRNGLQGTWDEVTDDLDCVKIRTGFERAVLERKIPCFATTLA